MSNIVPPTRPRMTSAELSAAMAHLNHNPDKYPILVVGIRGYYAKTMGGPGNDRGMYDDAIFLVTPNVFAAFNGNTDPTGYRQGSGTGSNKGMAVLRPGYYPMWRFDMHRGKYMALCQRSGQCSVMRDGKPPYEDTGFFGINCHRGGVAHTSSEGCQTIPPEQWSAFYNLAETEAKRLWGSKWREKTVAYALIDSPGS